MKNPKNKILVIIVMSVFLASSLLVATNTNAQQLTEGYISVNMMSKDTQTGAENLLSNVVVNLLDYNGNIVASNVSNPTVIFHVPLGNYIIDAPSISLGSYVYEETKEQITLSSSNINTNLTMYGTALNNSLSLKIHSNNVPLVGATVYYYTTYGLEYYSGLTGTSGNITANVTYGTANLKVLYVAGGSNEYYYTSVAVTSTSETQTINVGNYNHIFGTVYDSSTGLPVSTTIRATLINQSNGQLWQTLIFNQYNSNGGSFNFYLPSSSLYTVVLTADGYNINTFNSQSGYHSITVSKVTNKVNQNYTFSSDFKNLTYHYSIQLNNESVISGFNYNNIGVLYYQLKYGNYNTQDLSQYFNNSIEKYTNKMILINNTAYQLQGLTIEPFTINYAGFTVAVNATYTQSNINVSSAISQYGYIPLNLNIAQEGQSAGAKLNYSYSINIPSQYERVNSMSGANISGYINTINIYNVSTTSMVLLKLETRQNPAIVLNSDAFALYWKGIQSHSYILNQSATNYTIIVPANKAVSYNASDIISDIIAGANWHNTNYSWRFDNGFTASGIGSENETTILAPGIHTLKLSITDVGFNTNTTTIKIYADAAYSNTYSTISINKKVLISWTVNNSTNKISYSLNGTQGSVSVSQQNSTNVATLPQIKINETQLFEVSALYTNDTINGQILSHMPVFVLWHINNTNMSGDYNNASINYPTWNKVDWINVTYTDTVNNSITISIPVKVLAIEKPNVVVLMYNQTGAKVSSILQNSIIKLDGLNSTDPQGGTIVSYLWTIHSSNGTAISPGTAYNITSGTMTGSVVSLNFTEYGFYYVLLNVTDISEHYNVYNQSLQVIPVGPDLVLNSFNWTGTFTQGTQSYILVNISNTGNAPALQYNIILYVNGKVYSNTSYTNLLMNKSVIHKISWTPPSSGNFTLKVRAYTPTEPAIYLGDNVMSKTVSVNQAAWILPAIIIGIIVIIVVVAFVAFRLNKSKTEQTKFKKKGAEKAKPKDEKKKSV